MEFISQNSNLDEPVSSQIEIISKRFYQENKELIYQQTDRMFSFLITIQWLIVTIGSLFIIPKYIDLNSRVTSNPWQIIVFSGLLSITPVLLGIFRSGKTSTRYVIAISQMAITSLLFDAMSNNVESHFYLLGSIALLAIYRDWQIPLLASVIVTFDHILRDTFYINLFINDVDIETVKWLEHGSLLIIENIFLVIFCLKSQKEMYVTNRKAAVFYERENRFQSLMENSDDLIYFTDSVGRFTMVNPYMAKVFGFPQNKASNYKYLDFVAPRHKLKVGKFYVNQVRNKIPKTYFEFLAVTLDGKEIWLSQKLRLLMRDGEIIGFQAIARDITSRVIAEKELAKSESRLQNITNTASDAIITANEEGKIIFSNQAATEIFGYEFEELHQKTLFDLISEKQRKSYQKALLNYLKTGKKTFSWQGVEILAQHKDGRVFPIEMSFGEHNSEDEDFFTAVVRDITERNLQKEAFKKNEEYRNLFQVASDAIIIFEPEDEIILDVNEFACKIYGYSREEFIGQSFKNMSENAEKNTDKLEQLLNGELVESFESTHIHKDGTHINLLINASLIDFDDQKAILSINRDISARVKSNQALTQSEYKLRTLIESMSEGLVQTDNEDNIVFVNKRFCEMTEYSESKLIGQKATRLLSAEESKPKVRKANIRRKNGVSETYETQLITKSGKIIWSLVGAVPLHDESENVISSMSVHTDITERKIAEEKLLHNALHDALTGLPNRALFLEHLRRVMGRSPLRKKIFAVLFLDFDGFKLINDSLGHMQGDILLGMIAERLKRVIRSFDVVARLGGDEFTILLDELTNEDDYIFAIERIEKEFDKPFYLAGNEVFIGASIGIALSNEKYKSPQEILRDADIAMYRAKSDSEVRYKIFNKEMHEQVSKRLQFETDLRMAIERKEFEVFYQPIMNLVSERLVGFEALIRWNHPKLGQIMPNDFIPIVEENGLILPIGEWVLQESCRQIQEWRKSTNSLENLTLSVNLSCKQFMQTDLVSRVDKILNDSNFEANLLRLEITETHVMENSESSIKIMNRLREIGVQLSIDDFGTGYSSLNYLQRLPINFLKIDRSFVNLINSNQENSEIVRAIITLARNLKMDVIAEGIETIDQAEKLIEFDCNLGQGYYYARPTDAETAKKLIEREINLYQPQKPKLNEFIDVKTENRPS